MFLFLFLLYVVPYWLTEKDFEEEPTLPVEAPAPLPVETPAPLPVERPVEKLPEGVICTDDCPLIQAKIRETFPEAPELFVAIAKAESNLNPSVSNWNDPYGGSHGLLQVNGANLIEGDTYEDLYDIDTNLAYARRIYETQGVRAWGVCHNGTLDCGLN